MSVSNKSESELCVDELLGKQLPKIDSLISQLEQASEVAPGIIEEAKVLASNATAFIEKNHLACQIPNYVVERVQNSAFRLQKLISEKDLAKFKFKFKPGPVTRPKSNEQQTIGHSDIKRDKITNNTGESRDKTNHHGLIIENQEDQVIELVPERVNSQDVTLIGLKNCKVTIMGLAETVYAKELVNSTLTVCLAVRAVTVRDCNGCQFSMICQQLRIDNTFKSSFKTFIKTRAMLESSNELQFSQLVPEEHLESKGDVKDMMDKADFKENNWKCIDDFDWLSPNSPSKNYKLLDDT